MDPLVGRHAATPREELRSQAAVEGPPRMAATRRPTTRSRTVLLTIKEEREVVDPGQLHGTNVLRYVPLQLLTTHPYQLVSIFNSPSRLGNRERGPRQRSEGL